MAQDPALKYTNDHEWIAVGDDGVITVGITDYAADQLGDVVFVELPAVGATVGAGDSVAEIESTKSVGEVYAPAAGEIVAVNDVVVDNPELINADPFGAAWLFTVKLSGDLPAGLLDLAAYQELTAED